MYTFFELCINKDGSSSSKWVRGERKTEREIFCFIDLVIEFEDLENLLFSPFFSLSFFFRILHRFIHLFEFFHPLWRGNCNTMIVFWFFFVFIGTLMCSKEANFLIFSFFLSLWKRWRITTCICTFHSFSRWTKIDLCSIIWCLKSEDVSCNFAQICSFLVFGAD